MESARIPWRPTPGSIIYFCLMLALPVFLSGQTPGQAPQFNESGELVTHSGYQKLTWYWEPASEIGTLPDYELEQSTDPDFGEAAIIYQGKDLATFLSGLENGTYYYRVRVSGQTGAESPWSEPLQIRVEHHSLQLAFFLFGLGALVFLLTVAIVVHGNRQAKKTPEG